MTRDEGCWTRLKIKQFKTWWARSVKLLQTFKFIVKCSQLQWISRVKTTIVRIIELYQPQIRGTSFSNMELIHIRSNQCPFMYCDASGAFLSAEFDHFLFWSVFAKYYLGMLEKWEDISAAVYNMTLLKCPEQSFKILKQTKFVSYLSVHSVVSSSIVAICGC